MFVISLEEFRDEIDEKNEKILKLLQERFEVVLKILDYKKNNGLDIIDFSREQKILEKVSLSSLKDFEKYNRFLFLKIIEASTVLQFEKLYNFDIYKNILVTKPISYEFLKVCVFEIDSNLPILSNSSKVEVVSSSKEAIENVSKKNFDLAIVKTKNVDDDIFILTKNQKIYVNDIIEFKDFSYLVVSKKIYFSAGFSILFLVLEIEKERDLSLIISIFEIYESSILKLELVKNNSGDLDIYLKVSCCFESVDLFLSISRILKSYCKDFRLVGLKALKNAAKKSSIKKTKL